MFAFALLATDFCGACSKVHV